MNTNLIATPPNYCLNLLTDDLAGVSRPRMIPV